MHNTQPIWIKTSLVEKNIQPKRRHSLNDSFLEENEDLDWGWIKGEILNQDEDQSLTILLKDDESMYNNMTFSTSNQELQNGNIVIANIQENERMNYSSSSSSLESDLEEDESFHKSYPHDLTSLSHLHEPAILHVLRKRYENDIIYTIASESILVALNPFRHFNNLYSLETMKLYYKEKQLPPHVFSIADNAYRSMKDGGGCDQSILVSGESGAGKTVSTKYIMKYLAMLSHFDCGDGNEKVNKNQVEQQVLQSNPILESFGNARTIRNDNSSRFGKFIEIQFQSTTTTPSILGASIETYLLEKVRLIRQSYNERNFHIFYEILSGFTPEQREKYHLYDLGYEDFNMLSSSDTYTRRDGVEDVDTFDAIMNAFEDMTGGFTTQDIGNIFTVTCLCLHLSNVEIIPNPNNEDGSQVLNNDNIHLKAVLDLLGVSYEQFNEAICYFSIVAGKEHHRRCMDVAKAQYAIHGLIKACYASLFTFLVNQINSSFDSSKRRTKSAFIGILDIFGFESFDVNSFEQLCINFCNEALQNQFNLYIFQQEQILYKNEGIEWSFITFPDNSHVLTTLDSKTGLFQLLDDQCRAPGASDKSFSTEIYRKLKSDIFQADSRQVGNYQFSIRHYAGSVEYDIFGFVEKNKDEVPKEISELLDCSSNGFYRVLSDILKSNNAKVPASPRVLHRKSSNSNISSPTISSKKSSRQTTSYQFRSQLQNLLQKIHQTTPHYIRCIKPNDSLVPDNFDCKRIVNQLRCAGVVEAIRISRVGYPYRFRHADFLNSFWVLGMELKGKSKWGACSSSVKKSKKLEMLVTSIHAQMLQSNSKSKIINSIQVGKTMVFCNTIAYEFIHQKLKKITTSSAIIVQSYIRRFLAVQRYKALLLKIKMKKDAAIVIQKYYRMYACCSLYYKKVLYIILYLQRVYRGNKQKKLYALLLTTSRTIKLQSNIRMLLRYKKYNLSKSKALTLQCAFRCYKARVMLQKLKSDARDFQKVFKERNVLQKEKLELLEELKVAKEMLMAMQQQKVEKVTKQEVVKKEKIIPKQSIDIDNKSINSIIEQEKIITDVTNILSQQLLSSLTEENKQLHAQIDNKKTLNDSKIYNDYIKIKEDAKRLKDSLEESRLNQERLQNKIGLLMQERGQKPIDDKSDHHNKNNIDTAKTIKELQEEIKKLKERDAINTIQLEKLSKRNTNQHVIDSDDDSSCCESYEERIIAANAVYKDDDSISSSFFLDKEPFIPPDIYLPTNDDIITTTSPNSKSNFIHKFNNEELSQYDDLSYSFNTVDDANRSRCNSFSNNLHRPIVSSNHSPNQLQQTTKYSDLRNNSTLPRINSSAESSETSTASCITALTNQLDMANTEIASLKAKILYYQNKEKRKQGKFDNNIDGNVINKNDFSHTASSTTSEPDDDELDNDGESKKDEDNYELIKTDVPRNIEVDVSSKCEKLEQQIAHLERRLDNMSFSTRRSRTSGNNSLFSEDDVLSFRERSATRSTVVDDISFSLPSSINNEQVIHQLLSDNDFIRDAVRNHMEDYARNNLNQQNLNRENKQKEKVVTYPAVSCPMGRFFRSFVKSNGGPSSAQSAYSSAYMR